ncbi:MAG: glycosyltransferase [Planctomycetia bacterium]|nr:glycosyltransferase [Planctomycetia bacterium]
MKMALLGTSLHSGGGLTGGLAIIKTMPKIAPMHSFIVVVPEGCGFDEVKNIENVELIEIPRRGYYQRYLEERKIMRYLDEIQCDWAWWLGGIGFAFPKCRQSTYFRSAYHLNYPLQHWGLNWYSFPFRLHRKLEKSLLKRTMKHCQRIYVQTETVKRRFIETYHYEEERIGYCPLSFSIPDLPNNSSQKPDNLSLMTNCQKFKCLYLSWLNPHKNFVRIAEMFAQYKNELSEIACFLSIDPQTVSRKLRPIAQYIAKLVKKNHLEENIIFLGKIPKENLAYYYQQADCFFIPTLLETVGQGHLEAMNFHLPIIASDLDFAHEICEDAAHFVDPFSLESMKNGLLRLKNDPIYCRELVRRGDIRVQQKLKSWDEILRNVLDQEGFEHS